jgi:hypothetical protein
VWGCPILQYSQFFVLICHTNNYTSGYLCSMDELRAALILDEACGKPPELPTGPFWVSEYPIQNPMMACPELHHPRINKNEIKNIILGGGQKLLSPERRFDAALVASPELFT